MTSIAQGKRSDTLGKPPHPITPRPARAKVNITRYDSALLPLQGASYTAHYTQGAASLALGYELLPLRACPLKRALIERFSACKKICVELRSVGEHSRAACPIPNSKFHIQHSTFSTSLPQIYTVFPVAPHPAPKYAILAHLCNHLTFNHLPHKEPVRYPTRPIPPHEKPCFVPPSLPFRGSISYLSRFDT